MRALNSSPNVVDNSDLVNFPDGRIKDNDGSGNGTGVNERTNGDLHQTIAKLMRLYGIVPNNLPDNVQNGYQVVDALIALASKNDYVLPLTDVAGVLYVPVKISFMKEGESIVVKSAVNVASQTQISGSDGLSVSFTKQGLFKNNEYVRMIKTASGIELVRIADNVSLDDMVAVLNFLKKATQAEEDAGLIDIKATTPLSNLTAFVKRVIGVDSVNYLATAIRNGLYPKEHFSIVANLGSNPVRNVGWFSLGNIGSGNNVNLAVSGDITEAVKFVQSANDSFVGVTFRNSMGNTDFFVRIHMAVQSGDMNNSNDIGCPVTRSTSPTTFDVSFSEFRSDVQDLKVFVEVVKFQPLGILP